MADPQYLVCGGRARPLALLAIPGQGGHRASASPASSSLAFKHWLFRTLPVGSAVFFFAVLGDCALALPVVHDTGAGVPVGQHLGAVLAPGDDTARGLGVQFPVHTAGLRPGRLAGLRRLADSQWLTQPIFLVGADPASKRWLSRHHERLERLGAAGVVVDVPSQAAYNQLLTHAHGLPLAPVAMPWLAQRLATVQAAVYPLLILSSGEIRQDLGDLP